MAKHATLYVEKKDYQIIECSYEFKQAINDNNQPSEFPRGGTIVFSIVSPDNDDLFFHDWMQSHTEHKEGRIVFSVVEAGRTSTKTLHFKRAYCIGLLETFKGQEEEQMTTKITLSAQEIAFGSNKEVVFEND
jgi:hypothetical protein